MVSSACNFITSYLTHVVEVFNIFRIIDANNDIPETPANA